MSKIADIVADLRQRFALAEASEFRGQTRIVAARDSLLDLLACAKNVHGLEFLVDITCVDYLGYRGASDRFGLAYLLSPISGADRLTVRLFLNEPDLTAPSATPLWESANWLEREVWDMFGIDFEGHPDLRRILLPEEFAAHPLRKDYPLQGRGERHNFPTLLRGAG